MKLREREREHERERQVSGANSTLGHHDDSSGFTSKSGLILGTVLFNSQTDQNPFHRIMCLK